MAVGLNPQNQLVNLSQNNFLENGQKSNIPIRPVYSGSNEGASLQGRVSSSPQLSSVLIEALKQWKEAAEAGENREAAANSIMIFLQDKASDKLELKGYSLRSLPNIFGDKEFDRLKEIDLSGNWLRFLPQTFVMLKSLEVALVADNLLFELPEDISKLETLKLLDISDNVFLTELPANLPEGCIIQTSYGQCCFRYGRFWEIRTEPLKK